MKKLFFLILLFLCTSNVYDADRFWVSGGDGNWNNTNNWSTSSGGSSGASVPGTADDAKFDGNSGTGTATLNVAGDILSIDFTGFGGTFDHSSNTLTVSGNVTLVAGMTYTKGTGTWFIGATSTFTSGGKSVNNLQFDDATMTITLGDDATIDGTTTFGTDNTGVFTITVNSNNLNSKGNVLIYDGKIPDGSGHDSKLRS